MTDWTDWMVIDTLAAAYAEAGDFKQAIDYQKRAMNMTGVTDQDRTEMQGRLTLYKRHKPYREEMPAAVPASHQ